LFQENWGTDLISAIAALGSGYLFTSWQKASSNPLVPLVGEAVIGAGAVGAKHLAGRRPYLHEALEAVGYGSLFGIGTWVAEATSTLGGKGPGAPPVFMPGAKSAAAHAAAMRAAALAAARPQPDLVPTPNPMPAAALSEDF
jgi:hypothetical protein